MVSSKILKSCAAAAIVFLLAGCGGGGGGDSTDTTSSTYSDYTVSVVDDAILGAKMTAIGCSGFEELGNGEYKLLNCVQKPDIIVASGGTMDINGNGIIDDTDVPMGIPLTLDTRQSGANDNFIVTPLTTLAAAARSSELDTLASKLGITKEELFQDLSKDDTKKSILQLVNAQFIAANDNGVIDIPLFMEKFKDYILQSNSTDAATSIQTAISALKSDADTVAIFGGIGFNGFITEAEDIDVNDLANYYVNKSVDPDQTVFVGYVYDEILSGATVKLYIDNQLVSTSTTDSDGKFRLDINSSLIEDNKIVKLEASLDNYKGDNVVLVSYLTSDQIRDIAKQKISAGDLIDIIISNVTTAEYIVAKKLNGDNNFTDPDTLKEKLSQAQIEHIGTVKDTAALIKYIVDTNETVTDGNDTLSYVENKVTQNLDLNLTTEESQNLTTYANEIENDPVLSKQLEITVTATNDTTLKTLVDNGINKFYSIWAESYEDFNGTDYVWVYKKYYTEIDLDLDYMEFSEYTLENNDWINNTEWYDKVTGAFDNTGTFYITDPKKDPEKIWLVSSATIYNPSLNKHYNVYLIAHGLYKQHDDEFYLSIFDGDYHRAIDIDSNVTNWSEFEQMYVGTYVPFDENDYIVLNSDNTCDSFYWSGWEHFVIDGKDFIRVYSDYDRDARVYAIDYISSKTYYKYELQEKYIGKYFYDVITDSYDLVTAFKYVSDDDLTRFFENYDESDLEQVSDFQGFIENLLETASF
ncbi:hypothetical protein [Nitrosophilus labii]|uniref:hypothetical protein n=1 Tax=Nitrosophilus labii TaxID=2706014 RepID=UPI0016571200|nr:hypothetical protein [Nitrosophilus labii]